MQLRSCIQKHHVCTTVANEILVQKKEKKTLGDKLSKYYQELVCYVSDGFVVMNIIQYGCHILYQSLALIAWCPAHHILYELSAEKMPL